MSALAPGDFVQCVNNGVIRNDLGKCWAAPELMVGSVYRVEFVSADNGIWICDVDPGEGFDGYMPERFRPIYTPKSSIIEALKQPAPKEPVPA